MIASLRGTIAAIGNNYAVIDISGVGYKVFTTPATLASLRIGPEVKLLVHTAVREDALDLYGFRHENERRMFELLLTVSGIGPKSALTVLSLAGIETLASAIAAGKAAYLTNVSGIGKKTAEKIVLELKDKVGEFNVLGTVADEGSIEALTSLGYSMREAREALQSVPEHIEGESARLKYALRSLGK